MRGLSTMVQTGKSKEVEEVDKEKNKDAEERGSEAGEAEVKTATRTSPRKSQRAAAQKPITRSLAGRPIKRRVREDNALDPMNQPESPAKKPKVARRRSTRKQPSEDSAENLSHRQPSHSPTSEDGRSSENPSNNTGPSSSTAAIESSSTPEPSTSKSTIAERIGTTRVMRATLPIPVPNLTKKSRGRRVPIRTGAEEISGESSKDRRSYVCSVEGCGKCFHRGEHLKRHIRSIHTHEKPFKCTFPDCEKNFNRHDNLLQHIKVHKQSTSVKIKSASAPVDDEDEDASSDEASAANNLLSLSGSASSLRAEPTLLAFHSNLGNNVHSPLSSSATLTGSTSDLLLPLRRAYTQMSKYSTLSGATAYGASADASTFSSNMAMSSLRTNLNVSSLRTEVPDSSGTPESSKLGFGGSEQGLNHYGNPADLAFMERTPLQVTSSVPTQPMSLRPITTEQDWKS